jgi:hypothetical protein
MKIKLVVAQEAVRLRAEQERPLLTSSSSGDASTCHDHDPSGMTISDHLGDSRERSLRQGSRRNVILDEAGLLLAHLPS